MVFLRKTVNQLRFTGTVRVISGLAGSNMLAVIIGVIGSLVQARFVTPYDLGYLDSFSIVTGYALFLNLGLFESLHRLYPYYIGKGQRDRAISHAEIGQAWSGGVSVVLSSVFILLAFCSLATGNWRAMLGWLVQVVAIVSMFYGGYLSAIYRSGHDFQTVAKGTVISSVVNFLTIPLFAIWSFVTLVLRNSLGSIVNLIYLHIHRPLHLKWRINWREWYDLIKQGLPIFTASYGVSSLWSVLEMTIILRFLGTSALGLWTMSFMLFQAGKMVPDSINAVYFPRIYEVFGRTENINELWQLVRKPMQWSISGLVLIAALGCAVIPFIVPILMPKYVTAIPIMSMMMLILPLINLELPYSFLVAKGEIIQQNIIVFASMSCFLLLALAALRLGLGLVGVVAASILGRLFRLLFLYIYLHRTRPNMDSQ